MRISDWSSDVCSSDLQAIALGLRVDCRQTNHEGVLIDWLHEAHFAGAKAALITGGGYTHTSVALHDAIKSIAVPVIEVHRPEARRSGNESDSTCRSRWSPYHLHKNMQPYKFKFN